MENNIFISSLGCTKNLVDSESLIEKIHLVGFNIVDRIEDASVVIINTCGFIEEAKQSSINHILHTIELKNTWNIKIIVFGCLSERYKEEIIKEIPEVDYFFGINEQDEIVKVLSGLFCSGIQKNIVHSNYKGLSLDHIGYLKISEGCSNRCSYCAIPDIRGSFLSVKKEEIFLSLKKLLDRGAKEIILVGQDTSFYGKDIYKDYFLADLLLEIATRAKDAWIRLLYTHPAHLTEEVIAVISTNENICNYIEFPLQHINDRILKAMNRNVSKARILELIDNMREKNIAIRTSLITGFPGETEEEFRELLDFVKKVKFERLGVFKYSPEEDTPAFNYENKIDEDIKDQRFDELMSVQQLISKDINIQFVGKKIDVIIDGVDSFDQKILVGRTRIDIPDLDCVVSISTDGCSMNKIKPGDIISVEITDAMEYDFVGKVIL